jgi:uncharacterized protein (TIGR03435 family)
MSLLRGILMTGVLAIAGSSAGAQLAFDAASIRPTERRVKFERNGTTEFANGTLRMRDVTVIACIHLAYGTPPALIHLPEKFHEERYDITAKADAATTRAQMQEMMQALLKERFKLAFHREKKELRVYTLVVAKNGIKMKLAAPDEAMHRENTVTTMIARAISMPELADYLSDPLDAPLADETGLTGRYDLVVDFSSYVDMVRTEGGRPDPVAVIREALKHDIGIDMIQRKAEVDTLVVDHVETASGN